MRSVLKSAAKAAARGARHPPRVPRAPPRATIPVKPSAVKPPTRAAANAERAALKPHTDAPKVVNNNAVSGAAARATAAGKVAVAGVAVGGGYLAYDRLKRDVGGAASEVLDGIQGGLSKAEHAIGEGLPAAMNKLHDLPHPHLPSLPDGAVAGATSMLMLGLGVFAAYEVYRFTR